MMTIFQKAYQFVISNNMDVGIKNNKHTCIGHELPAWGWFPLSLISFQLPVLEIWQVKWILSTKGDVP
jgi:hypothetical protein